MKFPTFLSIIFFTAAFVLNACARQDFFDKKKYLSINQNHVDTSSEQVSFDSFNRNFFYTNSVEDYFLSLQRIQQKNGLGFSKSQKKRLFYAVDNETELDLKRLTSQLFIDAQQELKTNYYSTLKAIEIYAITLRNAVLIELLLMDFQRKVTSKLGPLNTSVDGNNEVIKLIQRARYRVFLVMLSSERQRAN